MMPVPTGRIVPAVYNYDLVLPRSLLAALQDAWAHTTDPKSTAGWVGTWEGSGVVGEMARLQLGFEEGQPWTNFRISACQEPIWLRVETHSAWDLSIQLSGGPVHTELSHRGV